MSWDAYITSITGSGHVAKAAIVGLQGGVWAATAGFNPGDCSAIVKGFSSPDIFYQSGIVIAGVKYMFLRPGDNAIYGKKGPCGVCVAKTNQAIVIGVYGEGMQAGQCNVAVEKIGDHLRNSSY